MFSGCDLKKVVFRLGATGALREYLHFCHNSHRQILRELLTYFESTKDRGKPP